jgi:hypothetical protein
MAYIREMTDIKDIALQRVQDWVQNFVSTKNPNLGNFPPCPFARESMISNKIHWLVNTSCDQQTTKDFVDSCVPLIANDQYEIAIIIHTNFSSWDLDSLKLYVEDWRQQHQDHDVYLLRDHPADKEMVANICMNQGDYLLFFVQKSSRLAAARKQLEQNGYYSAWSSSEIDQVKGSLKDDHHQHLNGVEKKTI